MQKKTIHQELSSSIDSITRMSENIYNAIDYLEMLQKDGNEDWQVQSSLLELKEAINKLGY